jgi:DNA polymerase-3 subunit beta
MKATAPREALRKAVQIVMPATGKASGPRPILTCVKVAAADDAVTLTATDTEIGVRFEIRGATVLRAGEALISARLLASMLDACEDRDATITADADGVAVMIGTSRFDMPLRDVAEFPDLPENQGGDGYNLVTAASLRSMISRVDYSQGKNDHTKFALAGSLWEAEANRLRIVTTDGRRLSVAEAPAEQHGAVPIRKGQSILPAKALTILGKHLSDASEQVQVRIGARDASFRTERGYIHTQLLEGRFPPYRDIVGRCRSGAKHKLTIPVLPLLNRVKQAAITADGESRRITATFGGGQIVMTAKSGKDDIGRSHVELPLPSYNAIPFSCDVDPKYVGEVLSALRNEGDVTLELSRPDQPLMFGVPDFQAILMPMTTT